MKDLLLIGFGKTDNINAKHSLYSEFIVFIIKQLVALIFGIMLIVGFYFTLNSNFRYDILFVYAIVLQVIFYKTKFETKRDILIIAIFHLVGLTMEIVEVSINGSWVYDSTGIFYIFSVPLFTGFMYASVGSYISKSYSLLKLNPINMPKNSVLIIISILIYINFIINNHFFDFRGFIYLILIITCWQAKIEFTIINRVRRINFLVAFFLIGCGIWIAENIATFLDIWSYPNQVNTWELVHFSKVSSWMLLSIVSFVIIYILVNKQKKSS